MSKPPPTEGRLLVDGGQRQPPAERLQGGAQRGAAEGPPHRGVRLHVLDFLFVCLFVCLFVFGGSFFGLLLFFLGGEGAVPLVVSVLLFACPCVCFLFFFWGGGGVSSFQKRKDSAGTLGGGCPLFGETLQRNPKLPSTIFLRVQPISQLPSSRSSSGEVRIRVPTFFL